MSARQRIISAGLEGKPLGIRANLGSVTVYELSVFVLSFCLALKGLYFIEEDASLQKLVSSIATGTDALLAIVVLRKLGNTRDSLSVGAACVLGLVCALQSASMIVVKGVLLVFGAKGEKPDRFLRAIWTAFVAVLAIGILSDILGFGPEASFRRNGASFGFGHPNQAALFACVAILALGCSEPGGLDGLKYNTPKLALVAMLLAYIWFTGSRTSLVVLVLAVSIAVVHRHIRTGGGGLMGVKRLLSLAAPAIFAFTLITSAMLLSSGFVQGLNDLTSERIWLNWFALENFSVTLFGQVIDLHVLGVHNLLSDSWNVTTTVDNTYIAGLLQYGAVATLLWCAATVLATSRAWESGNDLLLGASVSFAFYAFSESQLMDPLLYFTLLCLLIEPDVEDDSLKMPAVLRGEAVR